MNLNEGIDLTEYIYFGAIENWKSSDRLRNHLIFSPDVVWALVPAVVATLKNTILTLWPVKKPRPSATTRKIRQELSLNKLFTL